MEQWTLIMALLRCTCFELHHQRHLELNTTIIIVTAANAEVDDQETIVVWKRWPTDKQNFCLLAVHVNTTVLFVDPGCGVWATNYSG